MSRQTTLKYRTPKFADLLKGLDYQTLIGDRQARISGISIDSRTVKPGDLFIAVKGLAADGHRYIAEAVAKGCAAVLAENDSGLAGITGLQTMAIVPNSRLALGHVAAAFYGRPAEKMQIIGITGTNGKTTTSYLVEAIIKAAGGRPGVIGTVNYRYGGIELPASHTTPEAHILQGLLRRMAEAGTTHVIMEVSSHALAQNRLAGLMFDIAVFTNLSRDHLDYHIDFDHYFASKSKLFLNNLKQDGRAVIVLESTAEAARSSDRGWGGKLAQALAAGTGPSPKNNGRQAARQIITCGLAPNCDVHPENFSFDRQGIRAAIHTPQGNFQLNSPLVGDFNLKNLLAGTAVGLALNYDGQLINSALSGAINIPGRLERVNPPIGPAVFVDYAHTPDALEKVLQTLRQLNPARLICVFGCGGDRDAGKRPLMGEVAGRLSDLALVTADNPRTESPEKIMAEIEAGLKRSALKKLPALTLNCQSRPRAKAVSGYALIASRRQAIKIAIRAAQKDDLVLISGKGHESYQIVNADKIFFDDRIEARAALAEKSRPAWSLARVLEATGGQLLDRPAEFCRLFNVCTDSRTIDPGDLFLCLAGPRFDGLNFIEEAVGRGAAAVVVDRRPATLPAVPVVLVADTLKALGDLAAFRRGLRPDLKVIAITGSSGKTTVKEMTAAILATKHKVLKTKGNFNNLIGLPLSLLAGNQDETVAVLEMGMNRPGEIARLAEIARPDISCITNIQEAHLAGLANIDGVARAKGELFAGTKPSGTLIVNIDDAMVSAQANGHSHKKITCGRRADAFVRATYPRNHGEQGMSFNLHLGDQRTRVHIKAPGRHNVINGLTAAALAYGAGMSLPEIAEGLSRFRPCAGRFQIERLACGLHLIDDSYNANPASMRAALETLHDLKKNGKAMAILGDMLELGTKSVAAHRLLGATAAELAIDFLAVTGAYAGEVINAAQDQKMPADRARIFVRKEEITAWLTRLIEAGELSAEDWLLVKGSRGMRMETVINQLREVPGPAVHGSAVHGSTVHGSTVHGSAVHGSTVHGSTVHGSAVHRR